MNPRRLQSETSLSMSIASSSSESRGGNPMRVHRSRLIRLIERVARLEARSHPIRSGVSMGRDDPERVAEQLGGHLVARSGSARAASSMSAARPISSDAPAAPAPAEVADQRVALRVGVAALEPERVVDLRPGPRGDLRLVVLEPAPMSFGMLREGARQQGVLEADLAVGPGADHVDVAAPRGAAPGRSRRSSGTSRSRPARPPGSRGSPWCRWSWS